MVKIALIKFVNEYDEIHPGIDMNTINENSMSHYLLKENLEDFVEFIDIKNSTQLMEIINKMNKDGSSITIDEFHYDSDYVFQGLFLTSMENTCELNKLGTQFIREKMYVVSDLLIIKRSIINKDFDYKDVTFEDITSILKSQFYHQAIILKPNGEIIEKSYMYHPLEINFDQSHLDNTRIHELKILDLVLNFHIDIKSERSKSNYNIAASNIYKKKIYGNVLISLSDGNDNYQKNIDLDRNTINNIINISSKFYQIDKSSYRRQIDLDNLTLNDDTRSTKFIHNNFPVVALCPNFYYILKNENQKCSNLPENTENLTNIVNDILNDIE
jgi:hypothetical protein